MTKREKEIQAIMGEFKNGTLFDANDKKVTDEKEAMKIAIAVTSGKESDDEVEKGGCKTKKSMSIQEVVGIASSSPETRARVLKSANEFAIDSFLRGER